MYRSLTICLMAIGWSWAAIVSPRDESRIEQTKQPEESNQRVFTTSRIGSQQPQTYVPAQGNQPAANQYFYPTYSEYGNSGYAVKPAYESYLVPAVPSPQRDSDWATDVATSLLPFSSEILVYGMRAGAYLLHFVIAILLGGAFTTMICTFTPLCTISFLGVGFNKEQVRLFVHPIRITKSIKENLHSH